MDYSLYLVTDRELSLGRATTDVVQQAIRGGITCVQLREKDCPTREFLAEAEALKKVLRPARIPLIINDRVDIALAVEADGVHLGQSDMDICTARKLVGSSMVIGISAENLEHAVTAEQQGADYIGISPVFSTATKADAAQPLGLNGVAMMRQQVKIPLVGIGGITADNAAQVVAAGADGVAVVSAIVSAKKPDKAAAALYHSITWQVSR